MESSIYVSAFKALGDVKRMQIIDMLSCGELCACNILEQFEMSQSTLSHHMKILCESNLVSARNQGKWTYYTLNKESFSSITDFINTLSSEKTSCSCHVIKNKKGDCDE